MELVFYKLIRPEGLGIEGRGPILHNSTLYNTYMIAATKSMVGESVNVILAQR